MNPLLPFSQINQLIEHESCVEINYTSLMNSAKSQLLRIDAAVLATGYQFRTSFSLLNSLSPYLIKDENKCRQLLQRRLQDLNHIIKQKD